jgi:formylglycine-generating enzyme required for sulfatase activity
MRTGCAIIQHMHTLNPDRRVGAFDDMVRIEAATFLMGSDRGYPEERPRRKVAVDAFLIDRTPVTNRQFAAFVAATGHVTFAEIAPDPRDYPGVPPELCAAGSAVFIRPDGPVPLDDHAAWWQYVIGANWRQPEGEGSSIAGLEDHPVVHIAHQDALAFADWAGKSLPTEAEWELAARGGLDGREYAWGDELAPEGRVLCNHWHGEFPWQDLKPPAAARTTPVGAFPANGFGLVDMIGNVWEWTDDWYGNPPAAAKACCVPRNPRGALREDSIDMAAGASMPRKVLKGGSHLCAPNYCERYRPSARIPQPLDTTTGHLGFRCVVR